MFIAMWCQESTSAEQIIKTMDEAGVSTLVDLDGLWENELKVHLKNYREKYPRQVPRFR